MAGRSGGIRVTSAGPSPDLEIDLEVKNILLEPGHTTTAADKRTGRSVFIRLPA